MDIIKQIAEELQIKTSQAETAVRLIDEGNNIPFIARSVSYTHLDVYKRQQEDYTMCFF